MSSTSAHRFGIADAGIVSPHSPTINHLRQPPCDFSTSEW